jgi:hypothetical protein
MRLIQLAGAVALTALTLAAAPSFAQERYGRQEQERRVSTRRPTISLSLVFGNTRPYYSSGYRGPAYDSRVYSYGRSSSGRCSRGARSRSMSYGYGRNHGSYGSRYSEDREDDDYGRTSRDYRGY